MKIKCSICGKTEDTSKFIEPMAEQLIKTKLCFSCNFWTEQHALDVHERKEHGYAIIDGAHYVLKPSAKSGFIGFAGRKFIIKFHDGAIVECNNLWHQGKVPQQFEDIMPDNAVFLMQ